MDIRVFDNQNFHDKTATLDYAHKTPQRPQTKPMRPRSTRNKAHKTRQRPWAESMRPEGDPRLSR